MAHLDTFSGPDNTPEGWGELHLEPWCVREGLPLGEFLMAAEAARCEAVIRHEPQFDRDVVTLASGIEVGFDRNGGLFGMWRVCEVAEFGVASGSAYHRCYGENS